MITILILKIVQNRHKQIKTIKNKEAHKKYKIMENNLNLNKMGNKINQKLLRETKEHQMNKLLKEKNKMIWIILS